MKISQHEDLYVKDDVKQRNTKESQEDVSCDENVGSTVTSADPLGRSHQLNTSRITHETSVKRSDDTSIAHVQITKFTLN